MIDWDELIKSFEEYAAVVTPQQYFADMNEANPGLPPLEIVLRHSTTDHELSESVLLFFSRVDGISRSTMVRRMGHLGDSSAESQETDTRVLELNESLV